MKWRKFSTLVILTITSLVLFGTTQVWASGTTAGTQIDNQASVSFTLNGTPTSVDSPTESFLIDRKICPVVANVGNASVIAGGADYALAFTSDFARK